MKSIVIGLIIMMSSNAFAAKELSPNEAVRLNALGLTMVQKSLGILVQRKALPAIEKLDIKLDGGDLEVAPDEGAYRFVIFYADIKLKDGRTCYSRPHYLQNYKTRRQTVTNVFVDCINEYAQDTTILDTRALTFTSKGKLLVINSF